LHKILNNLIELQKVDLEILEITNQRDAYPARVQLLTDKIDDQEYNTSEQREQWQVINEERTTKEKLLKEEEAKLKKWEKRLMESKNPREAAPLSREIDTQKRANLEAQEEIIALMDREEELKKRLEVMEADLSELQAKHKEESTLADVKVAEFNKKLSSFSGARDQYLEGISSSYLRKYEQIRKRRNGLAVVPAEDGRCTGCNMRLRPQLYNMVQRMEKMQSCPNCHRIMYWEVKTETNG
jgi:predicted  nucleic acid-binding Zn-ribbon protein